MTDLREKYLTAIANAADETGLEDLRLQALGKKGEISLQMRELGKMTPEERQTAGPALNALKDEINSALVAKKSGLADAALDERLRTEWLDVTLPRAAARQARSTRSPKSPKRSQRSSPTWGSPSPKARRSNRLVQLRRAQHPRPPPGTRRDGHVLHAPRRGR